MIKELPKIIIYKFDSTFITHKKQIGLIHMLHRQRREGYLI